MQEIDDPSGYITNLARPRAAAREARIAQADSDREATERDQEAEALMAEARRHRTIKQHGFQAEIDVAHARDQQAGPLAEATAKQEVVVQEAAVASHEAEREEMRLQATVRPTPRLTRRSPWPGPTATPGSRPPRPRGRTWSWPRRLTPDGWSWPPRPRPKPST